MTDVMTGAFVTESAWLILIVGIVSSELMLTNLIGVCPLLAVSKKLETAFGLALAIIVIQPLATGLYLLVRGFLPQEFRAAEIALPLIVLTNLTAVYGVTIIVPRINNQLLSLTRPFMSILNMNCVLLGVTLLSIHQGGSIFTAFVLALGYGFGLVVVAEIRERLSLSKTPDYMQGAPIILLTLGIVSMAITGVRG